MSIVTITSDIGEQDYLVGAVKGRLLQVNPAFIPVDITHRLSAFNYPQAAYVCRNAMNNFPQGSFHLILVDLFDERPDHMLLVEHEGSWIGCADNGLITMVLEGAPQKVVALPLDRNLQRDIIYCSSVIAGAFHSILNGQSIMHTGDPSISIKIKNPLKPLLGSNWIDGQIIFIDNFENVIVNITREDFETHRKGRSFKIVFKRDEIIEKLSETYADVPEGEKLAFFNSAGYMEIAINKGNAAGLFGLQGYSEKLQANNRMIYQSVRVYFE